MTSRRSAAPPQHVTAQAPRRIPPLGIAIAVSVLLHAALLAIRFAAPETYNRIFDETPLEVILVNTRTEDAPDKAQAIAQVNLSGGGNLEQQGVRAASPLPPSPFDSLGTEAAPVPDPGDGEDQDNDPESSAPTFQQLNALQREQMELLARVKQQVADLAAAAPEAPASSAEARELQKKRELLLSIVGEIERRIEYENSRPRRRYIGPATVQGPQALYYDNFKRKVEEKGTANFPQHNGQKLYGELILRIVVNHDGRVLETQVMQTSGNRQLDRRAEAIAVSAGPFGNFDTALRKFTDQLVIISRFIFAHNDALETRQFMPDQSTLDSIAAEETAPVAPAPAGGGQ